MKSDRPLTDFGKVFSARLDELNEVRASKGLPKLTQAIIAPLVIFDKEISDASKRSVFSQYLRGKDMPVKYLRVMAVLMKVSLDELCPSENTLSKEGFDYIDLENYKN